MAERSDGLIYGLVSGFSVGVKSRTVGWERPQRSSPDNDAIRESNLAGPRCEERARTE
jgi:hypothetical protein